MTIILTIIGFAVAFAAGVLLGAWSIERQAEIGYLTGHVDGYGKALADLGEVAP